MKIKNFSMIEMLVVCGILLFLIGGLFSVGNILYKKYYLMQGRMEMVKIQNGLAAFYSATGSYPPDYFSSSHNEDGTETQIGSYMLPVRLAGQWEGYQIIKDYYDKYKPPAGCPKALALISYNGKDTWGVWYYNWRTDIGGEVPMKTESGETAGFKCTPPFCNNEPCIPDDFRWGALPVSKIKNQKTGELEYFMATVVKYGDIDVTKVFKCTYGARGSKSNAFKCGSNPNDNTFSCGWHSFTPELWEGGYNRGESGKALYDFLGRPMKGRTKEGVATSPRFANAKPFVEFPNKLLRLASKPPLIDPCTNQPLMDTPKNFKIYGQGVYSLNDTFKVVDVWGNDYLFVSSCKEYTVPSYNNTLKPYQAFQKSDSELGVSNETDIDLYSPYYNPATYDLASTGPDGEFENWIPFDFKLNSPANYKYENDALNANSNEKESYIYGQHGLSDKYEKFIELPSEHLKLLDWDNDNLTNFMENSGKN